MKIREAVSADLEGILEVSEECGKEVGMKEMSEEKVIELVARGIYHDLDLYVADVKGEVCGAVVFAPCTDNFSAETDVCIVHICVSSKHRDLGIFDGFLNKIKKEYPGKTISLTLPRRIKHKMLKPTDYVYEVV